MTTPDAGTWSPPTPSAGTTPGGAGAAAPGATHNPDILTCLANLSADEVFTPPKLASAMLDALPQELFQDPRTTFLDPVTKSGVFLREIARRLNAGLAAQMPDDQKRIDHILTKQVFGLATGELTWLLARRSLYCSKKADGKYSIATAFERPEGHVLYKRVRHRWDRGGRCADCGANREAYDRGEGLEAYAYPFIHGVNPEKEFDVKFDVIVGNPPYQMSDGGGTGSSARPLYHLFIQEAKKLAPKYLSFVVPSRWFSGGKGLDEFRQEMLNDQRIERIVDYSDSREVFPGVDIAGGVNYFLWNRDYSGDCLFENLHMGTTESVERDLNEHDVLIRSPQTLVIARKAAQAAQGRSFAEYVSARKPFGLDSKVRAERERERERAI